MNRNLDKGIGKQVKGTIKEAAGKMTGDKVLKGEGKVQKAAGKLQTKVGNAQEKSRRGRDTTH